jgi:hypothetical protein
MHCSDEELAQAKAFLLESRRDTLSTDEVPCGLDMDGAYYMPALLSAYLEDGREDVVKELDRIARQYPWNQDDYDLLGRVFAAALEELPPLDVWLDSDIAIGPMEILERAAAFLMPFDAVVDTLLAVKMNEWLFYILHKLRCCSYGSYDAGRGLATDRMLDALTERFFEVAESNPSRSRELSEAEAYLRSLREVFWT